MKLTFSMPHLLREPQFNGEYVSFSKVAFEPKPFQKPHLPIWMSGDADAVLKRIARFATGWRPFLRKPDEIPRRIDFIKSQSDYKRAEHSVASPDRLSLPSIVATI
jgi:alkanesulfonate monooxygenase SsuD/methylene tetrahydromethanopterin reductase-like flavin-dependent oxidoreductase (luciferase family)